MNLHRFLLPALALCAIAPANAMAATDMESTFQDDPLIVNTNDDNVRNAALDKIAAMGVDRIRVSVFWKNVAPNATSETRPAFDATNPAAYPIEGWARYDKIVRGAQARGLKVNLNPTSPAPRWATGASPRADLQDQWQPDPVQFGQFVQALAKRYDGTYAMLPRVDYWSLWNEPNQGAWLAPQSIVDPRDPKRKVEAAPHLYRLLAGEAYKALSVTGHGGDTIIFGETAPKGSQRDRDISRPLDALRFLRQLYCLDDNLQILKGTSAEVRNCPTDGNAQAFVDNNPVLFKTSGYAHHPYELLLSPTKESGGADWVTIADLNDLQSELKRIYARYGQRTQDPRGVPLYLTEFGYQTPPDPISVTFAQQAAYLNQSEFIAYKNRLVRTLAQFLLNDDAPVAGAKTARDKYLTFQSGLRSVNGKEKPSLKAYVTPIFIGPRAVKRGKSTRVWAGLRPATGTGPKQAQIQFRRKGSKKWRTVARRNAKPPSFYLDTRVKVPGTGAMRILWQNGSRPTASRAITVRVR